jgi:acyl carrier protein
MKREELVEAVIDALRETQRMSGHDADTIITEATVPIGDLVEFDSCNGVEATLAVEERIGHSLPVNLFSDDSTSRPLSIGEVIDRLLGLKPSKET